VYEVEGALPQVYVAFRQTRLPAGRATIERIAGAEFEETDEVVLNDSKAPALKIVENASGTARIVERTLRTFVVDAESNSSGYLVALHSYMPGWRVSVDGKEAEFYRANQLFMAVPLEAGKHRIEFSYRPTEVILGFAISLSAAIIGAAYILSRRSKLDNRRDNL